MKFQTLLNRTGVTSSTSRRDSPWTSPGQSGWSSSGACLAILLLLQATSSLNLWNVWVSSTIQPRGEEDWTRGQRRILHYWTSTTSAIAMDPTSSSSMMVQWTMIRSTSGSLGWPTSCPPLSCFLSPWTFFSHHLTPLKTSYARILQVHLWKSY